MNPPGFLKTSHPETNFGCFLHRTFFFSAPIFFFENLVPIKIGKQSFLYFFFFFWVPLKRFWLKDIQVNSKNASKSIATTQVDKKEPKTQFKSLGICPWSRNSFIDFKARQKKLEQTKQETNKSNPCNFSVWSQQELFSSRSKLGQIFSSPRIIWLWCHFLIRLFAIACAI